MIKITTIYDTVCKVLLQVEPFRPDRIYEEEIGEAIAKKSPDHVITNDGEIYKSISSLRLDHPIQKLKEMQEEAQEEFSQRILKLKNKMDEFKLLQELTKKKENRKTR